MPETAVKDQESALARRGVGLHERGFVQVPGETVGYELRSIDTRSDQQRESDAQRGAPDGNIMVVIPGHGQTVHGPKKLAAAAALLSKSKMAWCIDLVPARRGDLAEAEAIAQVVRDRISKAFPTRAGTAAATLIGWSHGGSEALRAAEQDPELFPQVLGLCPTGLVDRRAMELFFSFCLEAWRILWSSLRRQDLACLADTLRLGWNAGVGLLWDLWRSRSLRRLAEDIGWAGKRVTGRQCGYSGEVVLLFGAQDTVVRWRDVFPECAGPEEISSCLTGYQHTSFPQAARVGVRVIEGTHVGPEVNAPAFLEAGLRALAQLDVPRTAFPTQHSEAPEA